MNAQKALDMHNASMAEVEKSLREIVSQLAAQPNMLSVSDDNPREVISKDFPYPGATRALLARTPQGLQAQAGASGLVIASNANRIGGIIVNKAAQGVTLYLSAVLPSATQTVLSVYLPTLQSWQFLISGMVWCGNVFAVADTGNLNLAGGEI